MNVNQVNKLLVALVVLLLSGVAVLAWRMTHRPRYAVPVNPPVVPTYVPAADRQKTEENFQRLHASFEKYAVAQAERDRRLEERMAAAVQAGDAPKEQRLQAALEQHRRQWDEYQERYRAWEERIKEPPPRPDAQETSIELPPSPPLGESSDEEDAPAGDDGFGALAEMVGAGVCIAQPELCPLVLAFVEILKGLSLGEREEVLRLGEAIALGQGVPPDVMDAAGKLLRQNPDARQAIEGLIRRRAELGLPESPEFQKALEDLGIPPVVSGTGLMREVEALLQEERCNEACALIEQRWERASALEKDAVRALANRAGWAKCLDPCMSRLAEEQP